MGKQVILIEAEAKVVMQALDATVRQGGLNAAAQILPIARSIEAQLTVTEEKPSEQASQEALSVLAG